MTDKLSLYKQGPSPISEVLESLENKSYFNPNNSFCEDPNLLIKLQEITNWFNGVAKTTLLRCTDKRKSEEYKFLLLGLKKSVKHALQSVGKSSMNLQKKFFCSFCDDVIYLEPWKDPWESLQNHEHFEQLYNDYLTVDLENRNLTNNIEVSSFENGYQSSSSSRSEPININLDPPDRFNKTRDISPSTGAIKKVILQDADCSSSTVKETVETTKDTLLNGLITEPDINKNNVNSFKFNFVLKYDDKIENLIYPGRLMFEVQKIDGIQENTIQKCGKFKIVCLLCQVDLTNRSKFNIGKHQIIDHISGQRHYKFTTSDNANLAALLKYHDIWHSLDEFIQSHQVYFMPFNNKVSKCVLCNMSVDYSKIESHIQSEEHKKYSIETFLYNRKKKIYSPEILEIQLKGYNVEKTSILPKPKTNGLQEPTQRKREVSQSSSTPENENSPLPQKTEPKVKFQRPKMEHKITKSIKNRDGTELSDIIPNRFQENLKFFKKIGETYMCSCCGIKIGSKVDDIVYHITRSSHLQASKFSLKKYKYICEICDILFTDEGLWTKHMEGIVNKHVNMAASRKLRVTEYECSCGLIIYGDELSIERHLLATSKRDGNKKVIKLPDEVKTLFPSNSRILEHGEFLTVEANSVLNHKDRTYLCCQRLENVLSEVFPGCVSYPFGSRISGLGNKDSDLDVFIDVGDMYAGEILQDGRNQINFVRKSTSTFSKFRDEFKHICPIPSARTPIVKLYHAKTGLECDISFRHGLSVENTKFISFCIKLQPLLQPFILLLKKWSAICRFDEHITTYAFAILAIFYMQVNGYLLSVAKIRELDPNPQFVIDGWETFNDTLSLESNIKTCPLTLIELLKGFFQYYSSFDYEEYVICPLLGTTIQKKLFTQNGNKLPPQMMSYVRKITTMEDPEYFRDNSTCCIQDPFDLSHNLTKACQPRTITKLKILCDLTLKHLLSIK